LSALVNHVTRHALIGPDYESISNTIGVAAVVFLLVLLLLRELVRAFAGSEAEQRLRALTIMLVPAFLCFVAVEAARFVYVIVS
jgi:hypothetical protein